MKAPFTLALVAYAWFFSACGGGTVPPTMEGREGMLSRTAVAQKCDRASEEHLRPFVVEWDATDLSTFEAKARGGTILVRYQGCELEPLYECSDAARPFGAYGTPEFTSGTVQGFDIANEGELYAELPLGAVKLAGRISAGETLHLKYFVSGVATASRDSLSRGDVDRLAACREATHFVWAYNLGAFELESTQKTAGSAEARGLGAGVGASRESSEAQLGHGGKIDNCSTQEQLACRVPIRLELRPIRLGDAAKGVPPISPPTGPVGSGAEAKATVEKYEAISQLITDAAKKLNEQKDGPACLENLARVVQLDPQYDKNAVVRMIRPRCLMRASKCEEGKRDLRDSLAAEDVGRRKSDAELDEEVRESSNRECSAAEAKNPADRTLRILRELNHSFPKDAKTCQLRFDDLAKELPKVARVDQFERDASSQGKRMLPRLVSCVATAGDCKTAYALYERHYVMDNPKSKDAKAGAKKEWPTFSKREKLGCP